jgi:hypothetical protein
VGAGSPVRCRGLRLCQTDRPPARVLLRQCPGARRLPASCTGVAVVARVRAPLRTPAAVPHDRRLGRRHHIAPGRILDRRARRGRLRSLVACRPALGRLRRRRPASPPEATIRR